MFLECSKGFAALEWQLVLLIAITFVGLLLLGLSQKFAHKCFLEFPKNLPIMLFMLPIMLVLCSNMNNIDV